MEVKEENDIEKSKTYQLYGNEEHTGEDDKEDRISSTNEGETGDEGKCLKCNSFAPHFRNNQHLYS